MGIIPLTHPNMEFILSAIVAHLRLIIPTDLCDDPVLLRERADLKSISQNVMHSSVTITNGIYDNLVGDEARDAISHLGQERAEEINSRIAELLELLKKN